jgi:hypothetical protein
MSLEDFQTELLNHEVLLNHHQQPQQPPSAESGNFALYSHKPRQFNNNYSKGKPGGFHRNNSQPNFTSNHPKSQSHFSGGYQRNTYQQSYPRRFGSNLSSKPSILGTPSQVAPMKASCQICGKPGHQALDCFHQMNFAYQGKTPPSQLFAMVARTHHEVAVQHDEDPWYTDSGANNHITSALDNLNL